METLTVLAIAIALAMDCFAVSLAAGTVIKERKLFSAAVMAIFFGAFQSAMALIGWAAGTWIAATIGYIDHWVAFVILAVIGGKLVHEGFKGEKAPDRNYLSVPVLLILSIATSIDSLGVGLSLALLSTGIVQASAIIGLISLIFSFAGVMLGSRLSARFGSPVEVAGGIVLIVIGIRILIEHVGT
ncbi:MAG: manganese efflux pump MntP family protein [Methanoregulaceae archaeon]|jgi:putative Mn2+ efflux pump MntP|nr:manganese efflux pump MntP family protein [Methanoregulaceae archaeon]MCU0629172.1 manganese efflux pump MntP family protein [Methanoregulaceae archaeon]